MVDWQEVDDPAGTRSRVVEMRQYRCTVKDPHDVSCDEAKQTDANGLPAFADDGTDLTVIRWMLAMLPEERLRWLQSHMQAVATLGRDQPSA